jgi:hypothetical protein
MLGLLFLWTALGSSNIADSAHSNEGLVIERGNCKFEVEAIDSLHSDELWLLDYIDLFQSHNGPLLRYFNYADYRKQHGDEKSPEALLIFSQKVRATEVSVFKLVPTGGAKLLRTFIAKKGSGHDFGINISFSQCGNYDSEETVFFDTSNMRTEAIFSPPSK